MTAHIFLATPCYGGMLTSHFANSALRLQAACRERGVGLHVELMGGDALITRARSRLAAQFLAHPEATHLLFIDADIAFAPETVFRLLDADREVAGAVYPLKHIDWEKARAAADSARKALAGEQDKARRIDDLVKELGLEG